MLQSQPDSVYRLRSTKQLRETSLLKLAAPNRSAMRVLGHAESSACCFIIVQLFAKAEQGPWSCIWIMLALQRCFGTRLTAWELISPCHSGTSFSAKLPQYELMTPKAAISHGSSAKCLKPKHRLYLQFWLSLLP